MSNNLDLYTINYQSDLRSKPVRKNFTDIQNNFNLLRAEVYASIASTASEVVSGRGGFSALVDNINVRAVYGYGVNTGGLVEAQSVPDNTVKFSAGSGVCPDGSGVEWDAGNSSAVSAVTKPRYGIAVINSDNSFAIEWGATAVSPVLPNLSQSQLPLASIYQGTASPALFETSDISNYGTEYYNKRESNFTNINISGTLSAINTNINKLNVVYGQKANNILHGDSYTENDIFDALAPSLPNTNDVIVIHGVQAIASNVGDTIIIRVLTHAKKTSATKITIYGAYIDKSGTTENGGLYSIEIDDGDATNIAGLSLIW